jgi:predicted nucleic acid-binding protein
LIFVDSSFLIALLMKRDQNNEAATRLFSQVDRHELVTTNHVRGETWTWFCRKTYHAKAVELLDSVGSEGRRVGVDRISAEQEDEALNWLRRHDERVYSFVDATSFAYMRARRITDALAFDGDFAAAGFNELRP